MWKKLKDKYYAVLHERKFRSNAYNIADAEMLIYGLQDHYEIPADNSMYQIRISKLKKTVDHYIQEFKVSGQLYTPKLANVSFWLHDVTIYKIAEDFNSTLSEDKSHYIRRYTPDNFTSWGDTAMTIPYIRSVAEPLNGTKLITEAAKFLNDHGCNRSHLADALNEYIQVR